MLHVGTIFPHRGDPYEEKNSPKWSIVFICVEVNISKTRLFKYIEKFTTKKGKLSDKKSDIFHIPAQNISKKNNAYLCKPQFYYIIVGFKGVEIIQACLRYIFFPIFFAVSMVLC